MPEFVRPSYLQELPPTQRLADYIPAAPLPETAAPTGATVEAEAPPVAAPSEPPATTNGSPDTGVQPAAEPTDAKTVKRSGRITSAVHVVQRPTGTAVSFTLAETDSAGHTIVHRVYATKQFAERLAKQQLQQGLLVEVAGQPQLRSETQPDGAARQVSYFYCFGVRVLTPET